MQVTILNAGSFFGRLLPNFIADRIGPYNILIPCLLISSILAFSIFGIHTFAGVAIFSFLYGFWSGSCWCARQMIQTNSNIALRCLFDPFLIGSTVYPCG